MEKCGHFQWLYIFTPYVTTMNFFNLTFGFPAFSLFPHPSSPPFPSPFYLYFYKDKNKEKGVNCAKAPYRRDMGEMGGNGGGDFFPEGSGLGGFFFFFWAFCSKDGVKIKAPGGGGQTPPPPPRPTP